MKTETDLALEIHGRHMEKSLGELPDFDSLLNIAIKIREIESPRDLRFIAKAIELCAEYWERWTEDYIHFMRDDKSQRAYENRMRGEI